MNVPSPAEPGAAGAASHHAGAAVDFDRVTKSYGSLAALHPTSLRIEAGEFFAIIGPSGSGKSTLLGITAGFVTPSGGAVRIGGRDILAVPPYRRNIGMVFQNYALFPHMTVAENVSFPLRMRGMGRAEIAVPSTACWRWSGWPVSATAVRRSFRAASSSGWPWPVPPSTTRSSC